MLRWFSKALVLAAATLACWAAALWLWPLEYITKAEDDVFVLEDLDRDFGEVPLGESPLIFRLTNRSKEPRRIIGLSEG
jgi:hypothetical protein